MSHRNKRTSGLKKFFFSLNIIIAALFIIGCHAKWFDPVHWWFIGLVTLSATYLLALLFLFFIVWLFVKPRWAILFVIVIAADWLPILNIFPLRMPVAFEFKKQDSALRIVSWNVEQFEILHYAKQPGLRAQMFSLIDSLQPDIACFQEMVCADSTFNHNTPYYRKYGYYALNDFITQLHYPYHLYAYNKGDDFLYYEHFGKIIFSKYPLINKHIVSYAPHEYNDVFEYADMIKGKDTFRIFNVHLQSLDFTTANLDYIDSPSLDSHRDLENSKTIVSKFKKGFLRRKLQSERVKAELNKSPYPVILCGDFNDVPNSYAYTTIGNGLQNAFVEKGSGIGRTYSGISSTLRIDNIFLDPRFSVKQYTRIKRRLSDHFPVVTDVVLNSQ